MNSDKYTKQVYTVLELYSFLKVEIKVVVYDKH